MRQWPVCVADKRRNMEHLFFAQKAFIVRDRRLLLVRKSADDPDQPGLWEVPGGRMEFGEDVEEHLRREVREEVGLEIRPGAPFHIWQWRVCRTTSRGEVESWQIVAVARLCEFVSGEPSAVGRVPGDHLAEIVWAPLDELDKYEFIPNMRPVIAAFLATFCSQSQRS
jgi:8-oxo-dGTP pyrophosphatase MutT (NUDIX family)